MGTKRVSVSTDGGTTYRTLPGSAGDFREELATVTDTVFGQDYESQQVSVGQWNVSGNSFFKGVAGYNANIKQQGTPTTMTGEACSLVSGQQYQITNAAHRIISYFDSLTVLDNGVDHTANVASVDYLNGLINFATGYVVTGPVTVTGKYVPTTTVARARNLTLNATSTEKDTTVYETARANGGWRTFDYGLRNVNMQVGGVYNVTNGFSAAMAARNAIVIDVAPANDALTFFRGYFTFHNRGQAGNVGALEEETYQLGLWVPDGALVVRPFGWYFSATSTLNLAVQNTIASWQNKTIVNVKYQHDDAIAGSGHTGQAIVTEATLSNSFDGQNEFKFGFRGVGAHTAV